MIYITLFCIWISICLFYVLTDIELYFKYCACPLLYQDHANLKNIAWHSFRCPLPNWRRLYIWILHEHASSNEAIIAASLLREEDERLSQDRFLEKDTFRNDPLVLISNLKLFWQNNPHWQTRPNVVAVEGGWLHVLFNFAAWIISEPLNDCNVIRLWSENNVHFPPLLCLTNGRKELC